MSSFDEVAKDMERRQKAGNALFIISFGVGFVLLVVAGIANLRYTYNQCMKDKKGQGYSRTDADNECTEKVMEMLDL